MADSDNTTTLSCVTRSQRSKPSGGLPDPAVDLFLEWRRAEYIARVLCRHQQRLEKRVNDEAGFRGHLAMVIPRSDGESGSVDLRSELENLLQTGGLKGAEYAEADLEYRQQVEWSVADRRIGYSLAREAEAVAATAVLKLQDAMPNTVALSLQGIVAKLEMIVGADREIDDPADFPWPQITSVLRDLKEIAGQGPDQRAERASIRAEAERCLLLATYSLQPKTANQG